MKDEFKTSGTFRIAAGIISLAGFIILIIGFFTNPDRAWANYLLNNYYFLSLALGGTFFFAIQYISQSGWSAGFKRVAESMMAYLPVAAVFFLLLIFGIGNLYHWSHHEAVAHDPILEHKSTYLNTAFFYIRLIIYFILWVGLTRLLRIYSLKEDRTGGLKYFEKSHYYSKVLIFVLAFTFVLSAIDWIMSLDPHWYSTVFAVKNMTSAFLHGVSIMILIVFLLNRKGYFSFLNKYHLHDFSRYLFMLAIIWGYLWFVQFMLIWYGNIPEETVYYYVRWQNDWKVLFFAEIIINWGIPFFILLPVATSRNRVAISVVIVFLIIGQYIEQYLQIMPGISPGVNIGLLEIGTFMAYSGLFALVVGISLGRARIIPVNHPYLVESMEHHF